MRVHKGFTKRQSIFYYTFQQLMAFFMVTCIVLLMAYSCSRSDDWNLFAKEKNFEETDDFDYMLQNALFEIVRYNVTKSQLETDGVFDSSKWIDINAYANRKEKTTGESVCYSLEDLLKWAKYGVVYEYTDMDALSYLEMLGENEAVYKKYDGYLSEEQYWVLQGIMEEERASEIYEYCNSTKEKIIDIDINEENGTFYTQYHDPVIYDALTDYMVNGVNSIDNIGVYENDGRLMVSACMLQERYTTVDGKYLKDIAESREEYALLCDQLYQTVYDLSYNYNEYLNFKEKYENGSSNIAYIFKMTMLGEEVRVSNMPVMAENTLDEYFKSNYGKYIIYKPESMIYETNTGLIDETNIFTAFSNYEYAYPETAKVWLAVDTDYPVKDRFYEAAKAYQSMHPFVYWIVAGAGIPGVTWFALFLYLTVMTGNRKKKGAETAVLTLHWFDAIYTEIYMVLGLFFCAFFYVLCKSMSHVLIGELLEFGIGRIGISVLYGLLGMAISVTVCLFWYSLARRIKGKNLWKNSLLNCLIIKPAEKLWFQLYDNGNTVLWSGLPLAGAMGFNVIAGVILCYAWCFSSYTMLWSLFILAVLIDGFMLYFWIRNRIKRKQIVDGVAKIKDGEINYQVSTEGMHGENLELANAVNCIGEGIKAAVETSMKDERLKADLITNVSHDIKTPLTSIINYVDLLKREKIQEEPVKTYIEVLDAKSQRLKQLTDDLVEASKISSGNITLYMEKINLTELVHQLVGEFLEKFEQKNLTVMENDFHEPVYIKADQRRIFRVMENLFGNAYKYAMPGSRVYLDLIKLSEEQIVFSMKNISEQPLNIKAEELTQRFIRGDVSRSTEGSGLGLSIAENLTELQNGKFEIYLDGDLFKVSLTFPILKEQDEE